MNKDNSLSQKRCLPCEGAESSLRQDKALELLKQTPGWQIADSGKLIFRNFVTRNFSEAVAMIGQIARIAEDQNHHPDIHLTDYRNLKVDLSTHVLGGLSENDFIVASKINEIKLTE